MPPKKKSQKNSSETYYQPKKRKVLSPFQINSEQILHTKDNNGRVNGQSGQRSDLCVSPDSDQNSQNKRFHQSQQQYFDFGSYVTSNSDTAISMSFSQMSLMPFGNQFMASPPFNPQYPATGTVAGSSPPQWATQIMEDIKSIKISVSKIDGIEKMVHNINSKVNDLEAEVKTMDSKVNDCKNSNQFVSDEFEKAKKAKKKGTAKCQR